MHAVGYEHRVGNLDKTAWIAGTSSLPPPVSLQYPYEYKPDEKITGAIGKTTAGVAIIPPETGSMPRLRQLITTSTPETVLPA